MDAGVYITRVADVDGLPVPTQAICVFGPELVILSTMICPVHVAMDGILLGKCAIADVMHDSCLN